jgi:hypothetical protein
MTGRFVGFFFAVLAISAWRIEARQPAPVVDVILSSPSAELATRLPKEAEVGFNVFTRGDGKRVDGATVAPGTPLATLRLPADTELLVRGFQGSYSTGRLTFCLAEGFLTFMPQARYLWTFEYLPDHADPARTVCRSAVARLNGAGEVVESVDLTVRAIEDKSR